MIKIKSKYKVIQLVNGEYQDWLLKKHYAKRTCSVSYAFGLVNNEKIVGVITFGSPPNRMYNDGFCIFNDLKVKTLELNRLVLNSGLEKNLLSYFVSNAIKLLPRPTALVSYADPNQNHHGYIYQATNWIYTGVSTPKHRYVFEDGSTFDIRRGIDNKGEVVNKEKILPTHRYIYLHGNRTEKKNMLSHMKLPIREYPKGDNQRYQCIDIDMGYQEGLF